MEYIIIILMFYVLPALTAYLGIRRRYRRDWEGISPEMSDVLMVILPLFNIMSATHVIMDIVRIDYRKLFLLKDVDKEDE